MLKFNLVTEKYLSVVKTNKQTNKQTNKHTTNKETNKNTKTKTIIKSESLWLIFAAVTIHYSLRVELVVESIKLIMEIVLYAYIIFTLNKVESEFHALLE